METDIRGYRNYMRSESLPCRLALARFTLKGEWMDIKPIPMYSITFPAFWQTIYLTDKQSDRQIIADNTEQQLEQGIERAEGNNIVFFLIFERYVLPLYTD